ncbi:hypothetical protein [Pontibacter litorisediminis]|uniref:hypothetical protein n=1 Tax=Pontibacter litorisediminis TaxID=1846260 RepID=UPI0023ECED28|nr:hypothetical protein [Pontibacter litorisediminis]
MKTSLKRWLIIALTASVFGCADDDPTVLPSDGYSYTFEQGNEGWQGGFADYPSDWERERFEFAFAHDDLPPEVGEEGGAMRISGRNISDDLFLFMKKQITGLEPNRTYSATFRIELASQYPENSVGIGGSPGASVYLKAGGSTVEPVPVETDEAGNNIRMNIDKGNQSQGGEDMVVLGTVGIPGDEFTYQLIRRDNQQNPVEVTADSNGSLWVIVGTDSGFEGTTTLYYHTIEVELE